MKFYSYEHCISNARCKGSHPSTLRLHFLIMSAVSRLCCWICCGNIPYSIMYSDIRSYLIIVMGARLLPVGFQRVQVHFTFLSLRNPPITRLSSFPLTIRISILHNPVSVFRIHRNVQPILSNKDIQYRRTNINILRRLQPIRSQDLHSRRPNVNLTSVNKDIPLSNNKNHVPPLSYTPYTSPHLNAPLRIDIPVFIPRNHFHISASRNNPPLPQGTNLTQKRGMTKSHSMYNMSLRIYRYPNMFISVPCDQCPPPSRVD